MSAARVAEVAWAFLRLGASSFGGPVAHLGYLRAECVERRRWLDDGEYADLVALCQFLPGPSSSQVVFALGLRRAGLLGALAASLCFLLPSAAAMIAFAYGVAALGDLRRAGWLHGLKVAAVAVVAQAVWAMGKKLCPDRPRALLCLAAAAALLVRRDALAQLAVLALGAAAGFWLFRDAGRAPAPATPPETSAGQPGSSRRERALGAASLALFAALLFAPRALAQATGSRAAALFDAFYRPGALVFGGGHVVLPLLREAVVPRGWVSDEAFLAGYGAAQAVPGPLFSFASYLGAALAPGPHAWRSGVALGLVIFLPAWLLVGGALPFWHALRARPGVQAALAGANAAVVGVLLAALYSPVCTEALHHPRDVAAALLAFGAFEVLAAPPWVVVATSALVGQYLLPLPR